MPSRTESACTLIRNRAEMVLFDAKAPVKFAKLLADLKKEFPNVPHNTIEGNIWDLHRTKDKTVVKIKRGLFCHVEYAAKLVPDFTLKRALATGNGKHVDVVVGGQVMQIDPATGQLKPVPITMPEGDLPDELYRQLA